MKRVHVYISGWVQGVYFRHHTQVHARRYSVNGWVRNLPDGRVEATFEGEDRDVDAVVESCRRGPPGAQVEHVEIRDEPYFGEFKEFNVRR